MMTREQALLIKEEAYRQWVAPDGLMSLKKDNFKKPYGDSGLYTSDCDNGSLFLTYFWYLLYTHDILDEFDSSFCTMVHYRLLAQDKEGKPIPGLYHRNPGRTDSLNSIDNYCGIMAASALFAAKLNNTYLPISGHTTRIDEVVEYGVKNGWVYNNKNPGQFHISAWRQPADVGFYLALRGMKPSIIDRISFRGGLFITSFQDPLYRTSEYLMTWLRLSALDLCGNRSSLSGGYDQGVVDKLNMKAMGIQGVLKKYFSPSHPISRLAEGVWF